MANLRIYTTNASSLSNSSTVVYGGKNGFDSKIGSAFLFCNDFTFSTPQITLNISNLASVHSDFFSGNASYVRVPINQYSTGSAQFGAIGYTNFKSFLDLPVISTNTISNTIVVENTTEDGISAASKLVTAPFKIEVFQPNITDWIYVQGNLKTLKRTMNVVGIQDSFEFPITVAPQLRKEIMVVVDDVPRYDFTWPSSSNNYLVSVSLDGSSEVLEAYIATEKPPAIEPNDEIAIMGTSNTFTVSNVTFISSFSDFDSHLSNNRIYKIKFSSSIPNNLIGNKIINISPDLEGNVTNLTNTYFDINYPDTYNYTYKLANSKIYYLYNKSKVKITQGRLDEYGRLLDVAPGNYVVTATNINRYNRTSPSVSSLLTVEPLRLSKVTQIEVTESITIDTTGGAIINATVNFPPVTGVDIDEYEVKYRVIEQDQPVPATYTVRTVTQDINASRIYLTINNLSRGRNSGANILDLVIVPKKGEYRGYGTTHQHALIGKTARPAGVTNFSIAQQGDNLLFTWQLAINYDGFLRDPDSNDIEIREYPGIIDDFTNESLEAAWTISMVAYRKTARDSGFIAPVSKFGDFTYLIRVRDTSNIESLEIGASSVRLRRPNNVRLYKAYNETNAAVNYATQDGELFPNSNTNPELPFPSFSQNINFGLVKPNSSNVDNANGSSIGFSVFSNTNYLTTGTSTSASYISQIRDMGRTITGTVRVNPVISVNSTAFTFNSQKRVLTMGVTDSHASAGVPVEQSILVDNSAGGIGHILGFANSNAAPVTYNSYHRTLTSGGAYGNVYAIVSGSNTVANANSFALIAGVINNNAIRLGNVFHANGHPTGSNNFANVTLQGNAYQLVDLLQFGDPEGTLTFLGPETSVMQNVYIRYATDNVFYSAAANGVSGAPGHGNTNPYAFVGATTNAELGFKTFVPGQLTFRYFQIEYQLVNKLPEITEIELQSFRYEVDVQNKTFTKEIQVNSNNGVMVDYTTVGYIEPPKVTVTLIDADIAYTASAYNITNNTCNVKVFNSSTGAPVSTQKVNLIAVGI